MKGDSPDASERTHARTLAHMSRDAHVFRPPSAEQVLYCYISSTVPSPSCDFRDIAGAISVLYRCYIALIWCYITVVHLPCGGYSTTIATTGRG